MTAAFLYNLFIFPLVMVIDLFYVVTERIFRSQGIAVIGVGLLVSILTLPLYMVAETWQNAERKKIKSLKPVIDVIKSVFRGDQQYLVLSTYYRQQHYHPVFALRSSFGLLIQIPFFIAAYSYLSSLPVLKGTGYFLIKDLSLPDGLLTIGSVSINILPVVMTLLNIAASYIYTRSLPVKDKIQLYGMAAVFLALLYASPSGLVLYWTVNNAFSLFKNIFLKIRFPKKTAYLLLCLLLLLLNYLVFFRLRVSLPKRIFFAVFCICALFVPCLKMFVKRLKRALDRFCLDYSVFDFQVFLLSCLVLTLLAGAVIPGATIASSVEEFSFIEGYTSPLPFLFMCLAQAAGLFLILPVCIYFLFGKKIRTCLAICAFIFVSASLVNYFIFPSDYGFLTLTFIFSQEPTFNIPPGAFVVNSIFVLLVTSALLVTAFKFRFIFKTIVIVLSISSFCLGLVNIISIQRDFSKIPVFSGAKNEPGSFFHFSRTEPNVLIVMTDAAVGAYVAPILQEKPDLAASLSGFTWYPNTVSFATYTLLGLPSIFGGYEYTPKAMNARSDVLLREKHFEAQALLPALFTQSGYTAAVSDLPYLDLKRMADDYGAAAANLYGAYTSSWLKENSDLSVVSIPYILSNKLIRLSFLRMMPSYFRLYFYDEGDWLTLLGLEETGDFTLEVAENLALLDAYGDLSYFDEGKGSLNITVNLITHESVLFQYPDYTPATPVTSSGSGPFSDDPKYHVCMKALLELSEWFDKLKKEGVYDNTRIIIVSDHGSFVNSEPRRGFTKYQFNCLLMVKDFNAGGGVKTDNTFMTNADVPAIAAKDIIPDPRNPFTKKELKAEKSSGVDIANIRLSDFNDHGLYTYKIPDNEWVHVKDNIFDPANWSFAGK
jgi:YidC/Oxa1 family membrane protein insertase